MPGGDCLLDSLEHALIECDDDGLFNAGGRLGERVDGCGNRVVDRPRINTRAHERKRDRASTDLVGDLECAPVARDEEFAVAFTCCVVRPDDVDDVPRQHISRGRPPGIARLQSAGKTPDAVLQHGGPAGSVNRAVNTATASHAPICGVHDRVDSLSGDVALHSGDFCHASSVRHDAREEVNRALGWTRTVTRGALRAENTPVEPDLVRTSEGMSRMTRTPENHVETVGRALERVRETAALVQCLTNAVVTNFTANVLLALGAAPAMTDIPREAGPFAEIASGVLVNLGTPHAEQRQAMLEAATAARLAGTPWVLDPVAIGSLPVRTELAAGLLAKWPTVIRGNPSEILALAGEGAGGRGVDTADGVDAARDAAKKLASHTGGVVAVSGEIDAITDGDTVVRIANGSALLTRVTGGGCALGAVIAAFLSIVDDTLDALEATVAAVTVYTVASEIAAERSRGPGSFAVELLDALAALDSSEIAKRGRGQ